MFMYMYMYMYIYVIYMYMYDFAAPSAEAADLRRHGYLAALCSSAFCRAPAAGCSERQARLRGVLPPCPTFQTL